MGLLIYAVATIFLILPILRRGSRFLLLVLQFLPFFFLFFFFWFTQSNFRVLHVKKIGYQFDKIADNFREPARVVSIGGDPQKDDLYFAPLPPGAIRLQPALGSPGIEVETRGGGILILRNNTPLNMVPLKDGDRITCGKSEILFQQKGAWNRSFSANGKEWRIPGRDWKVSRKDKPLIESWATSGPYALQQIAKALGSTCNASAVVTRNYLDFAASRQPVKLNSVQLLAAGPEIRLNNAAIPSRFHVSSEDLLKIYMLEDSPLLHLIGTFRVRNGDTLDILYSTPQTLGIKEELLRNGSQLNKPLFLTTSSLPYSVFPTAQYSKESAKFAGLFAYIQTKQDQTPKSIINRLESWLPALSRQEGDFEIVTEEGTYRPSYGDRFTLGKKDRIVFSVQQIEFPWTLLLSVFVILLLKIIFQPPFIESNAQRQAEILDPLNLLMISIDFFLVTRFLFAFRAAMLYPFSQESIGLSCLAFLLVPYILYSVRAAVKPLWDRKRTYEFGAYSALLLLLTFVLLPEYLWICGAAAVAFATILYFRFSQRLSTGIQSIRSFLQAIPIDFYLLLFFLLILMFQIVGAGEAIQVGGIRFPLALLYHPAFILFSAFYVSQIRQLETRERTQERAKDLALAIVKLVLVGVCFLAASLLTSDLGFFLLYCIPVLFLTFGLSAYWISEYDLRTKLIGTILAVPAILFLILFSGSAILDTVLPVSSFSNPTIQRILLSVDPETLEQSGLLAAERQLGHQRTFLAYAHGGLLGGGFMNRPVTAALSVTALNDNVPAAFLLNDFGILGFIAVLLILLLWLWLWMRSRKDRELTFPRVLSISALITITYVDLYMIFSNCGIFLFSGKNVFLWGLNSISDIAHASILFALVMIPAWKET